VVVRWLLGKNLRPADLLAPEHVPMLAREAGLEEQRLAALLKRGVKLGFAVEQWNQSGIWVICRSDPEYPARYKTHLKEKAPPILFGSGERSLLQGGGLAIVGSRDVDTVGEAFARDVAERCGREGVPVVSGGARGVDQVAMASALEAGGVALGVLADTLLKRSVSRDARSALADGRLVLISPYHPEAGFNVGNAMGRNKLIYALADYGLVVSADFKKGGTWDGAKEELKRVPRRPVFVRGGTNIPKGNVELLKMGGRPFPAEVVTGGLRDALRSAAEAAATTPAPAPARAVTPELPVVSELPAPPPPAQSEPEPRSAAQPMMVKEGAAVTPATLGTVLESVSPVIVAALDKARTVEELAKVLNVRKPQMQDWVKALIAEGVLAEQVKRKVRKVVARKPDEELNLR
jgi:predicted Rossmann fold nucleotide-binding protein DprA/Smf involved in DNA uptake